MTELMDIYKEAKKNRETLGNIFQVYDTSMEYISNMAYFDRGLMHVYSKLQSWIYYLDGDKTFLSFKNWISEKISLQIEILMLHKARGVEYTDTDWKGVVFYNSFKGHIEDADIKESEKLISYINGIISGYDEVTNKIKEMQSKDVYEVVCAYREGTEMELITKGFVSGRKKARHLRDNLNKREGKIWNCQIRQVRNYQ